jgi:hypothetical protein
VIEGDDVGPSGKVPDRVAIGGSADQEVGPREYCRLVVALGQDGEVDTETDGGLLSHPGKLTGTDHADSGSGERTHLAEPSRGHTGCGARMSENEVRVKESY